MFTINLKNNKHVLTIEKVNKSENLIASKCETRSSFLTFNTCQTHTASNASNLTAVIFSINGSCIHRCHGTNNVGDFYFFSEEIC